MVMLSINLPVAIRRPWRTLPLALRAPVLGLVWVLSNVVLGWLGLAVGHLCACLVVAGALDGTVVSVIVVTKASDRLQAGIAGAFSGLGLDNVANGGQTLVAKAAQTIHSVVDSLMIGVGGTGNEKVHAEFEQASIQGVWIAVIVVLAALVAKWVQDSGRAAAPKQRMKAARAG